MPTTQIWYPMVVSCPKVCLYLANSMGMESNPYLEKKIRNQFCVFGEMVMTDSQKKYVAPIAPNKRTPTGAEFHPNLLTWNPLYDRYRVAATVLRQTDGPDLEDRASNCVTA